MGGEAPVGALAFNTLRVERDWPDALVKRLQMITQIFTHALIRRRHERALEDSEERLTVAADSAGAGLWALDLRTGVFWASERARVIFGYSSDEVISFELFKASVHPDDRDLVRGALERTVRTGEPINVDYRILAGDGRTRWITSRGRPQFASTGEPDRLMGVSIDVTERMSAEAESQMQRDALAHLSRVTMVGELSGSLAHELNQPLTAILSNAQAAQRHLANPAPDLVEVQEILKDIVSEDKRAGEVIRRLRALLRKGEVSHQPLDLSEVVEDVLKIARNDLVNQGVALTVDAAAELPPVAGDRVQLQQVLLNLILNGCDAMTGDAAPGDRRLTVQVCRDDGRGVRVSVADRGPGIPAEKLDAVFEPFFTTKAHGLGLGLAVCRTIIDSHGGRIWAENNAEPPGATFHFHVPFASERA
jgi:PAS domain S-box-containing protein